MVPEVHEIRECQGPHSSLGPLLPRVQTDLEAAAPGRVFSVSIVLSVTACGLPAFPSKNPVPFLPTGFGTSNHLEQSIEK